MNFTNLESSFEKLFDQALLKVPSILIGILILIVGRLVIRFTLNLIDRRFERKRVDISIRDFIKSIVRFGLYALLILTVANTMGIQTTSFIAVMSAFGLAVGLALQGSLSNFAGGVLILLFRPFDVGDYISSDNGASGTVDRIDLLYSTIIDDEGIRVFSPNGTLANSVIKNYSKITSRRMQFSFLISYGTDIKQTRESVLQLLGGE
ncbi:MAG: mechanosensitive ion channel family protein, partial [Sphingobacterium sp.]